MTENLKWLLSWISGQLFLANCPLLFTCNHIATRYFRDYTITKNVVLEIVAIYLSLETRLRAVFVLINNILNDASLTLQRKKYKFILKSYVRITLRIKKYM